MPFNYEIDDYELMLGQERIDPDGNCRIMTGYNATSSIVITTDIFGGHEARVLIDDWCRWPDVSSIEVPHTPVTDEDFAALPILDLDEFSEFLHRGEADRVSMAHQPKRGDDIELWLKRRRDSHTHPNRIAWNAVNSLLDRYRECAACGLSLRPEDEGEGYP